MEQDMTIAAASGFTLRDISALSMQGRDGVAMIGVWCCMAALAKNQPDGCVCLNRGLPMDADAIAACFHLPVSLVKQTVSVLQSMHLLSAKNGAFCFTPRSLPAAPVPATAEKSLRDAAKREQNRLRVQRWRARQKEKNNPVTQNITNGVTQPVTHPVTGAAKTAEPHANTEFTATGNAKGNAPATGNNTVTGNAPVTGRATAKEKEAKRKEYTTSTDIDIDINTNTNTNTIPIPSPSTSHSQSRDGQEEDVTETGNCLPFTPDSSKARVLIPLAELPDSFRRIVEAWNRLPLIPLRSLPSSLLAKLKNLLRRYPETDILRAIGNVAKSSFLLGKGTSRRWQVTFGWILDPDHFANVLNGKYTDWTATETCCGTGDTDNCYETGDTDNCYRNPVLDEMAQLLELPE
ncbi:MAG: phage replisome organizer N-terminal domain-containing protein [Acidaminococcaceae bacterium]|nr:phage replisome organizer N-terminal domain-containing protein [Acidaminococcaceae bacterium]MBP3812184.1 phage replisome organizer N-terminal domain-containing protein [Acidaminococcaceae bacterium]